MDTTIKDIYDNIMNGQKEEASVSIQIAIDAGVDPVEILNLGMIAAMAEVGRLFEQGEYYVPEMLIAARAMQTGLVILKPHLSTTNHRSAGKVVIGTIKGDLHDIGKNLVSMMLEGAGFEIQDLGVDVPVEKFVAAVSVGGVDIVALSALLTTTMPNMKMTIEALRAAGYREQVKVMIGGAPVTEDYARQIDADGFAVDASRAVTMAKSLVAAKKL
jgi:5-methyltetrahydrofolate--homocysteine methyltransferase